MTSNVYQDLFINGRIVCVCVCVSFMRSANTGRIRFPAVLSSMLAALLATQPKLGFSLCAWCWSIAAKGRRAVLLRRATGAKQ